MHPFIRGISLMVIATAAVVGFVHQQQQQQQKQKQKQQGREWADRMRSQNNKGSDDDNEQEEEDEEVEFDEDIEGDILSTDEGTHASNDTLTYSEYQKILVRNQKHDPPSDGATIGIDLGTSSSCVGVWENGGVTIIPNEKGNHTTPSCVSFTQQGFSTGDSAALRSIVNARNTAIGVKRLVGRRFTDHGVQSDAERYPSILVQGRNDTPTLRTTTGPTTRTHSPSDLSTILLLQLRRSAEAHLGRPVSRAVVAVPAHFDDVQRQTTRDAASRAGLEVLRLVNETTVAAMAYGVARGGERAQERTVLVYDLGGGGLDVSLLTIMEGIYEVEATAGDARLGGDDFTDRIVDYVLEDMVGQLGKQFRRDGTVGLRVRKECERVKCLLSTQTQVEIEVRSLFDGLHYSSTLTRDKLEELCAECFDRCTAPIEQVLEDATRISGADIDEVVLVGGGTRMPRVRKLLQELFGEKKLCTSVDPDTVVAYGATVQAAVLSSKESVPQAMSGIHCFDVAPFSLGLETDGGEMTTMVKRKSTLPFVESCAFTTKVDNLKGVLIRVFEGESSMTQNNNFLGEFRLDGITPMSRGKPKIMVTFDIDDDGILSVSAVEQSSKIESKLVIKGMSRKVDTLGASNNCTLTRYNPL